MITMTIKGTFDGKEMPHGGTEEHPGLGLSWANVNVDVATGFGRPMGVQSNFMCINTYLGTFSIPVDMPLSSPAPGSLVGSQSTLLLLRKGERSNQH